MKKKLQIERYRHSKMTWVSTMNKLIGMKRALFKGKIGSLACLDGCF